MRMPGFSGGSSLYTSTYRYRRAVTPGGVHRPYGVSAQLTGGGFHGPIGGTFGTIDDYYTCKQGCETARSTCLDTCEGTWESPKPSRNCWLCDDDYRACMRGCTRDIA